MIEDVLKGSSSCLKYWWWEKPSLLCFVIVLSKDWVTIAVLILIFPTCVSRGKKWHLPFAKIGRTEHILFVTTLNTNYRDTWHYTWSSSVLAKIFIIDGVAESVLLRTRTFFFDVVFRQINCSQNRNTWLLFFGVSRRLLEDIERV